MTPSRDIRRLTDIMAALRTPGTGCAWDLAQTAQTIVPFTIEETYEVADAVERGDSDDLRDELGDLLLQVVFQARIAEEAGGFAFGDVVEAITTKLIRRHPHIFDAQRTLTADEVKGVWASIKAAEKAERADRRGEAAKSAPPATLADVPAGFPPLLRALKLQGKAAEVGFDWNNPHRVLDKIREEVEEIAQVLDAATAAPDIAQTEAIEDEIGDLMFAAVNLARHMRVDPDQAMRRANRKFERRFGWIEEALAAQGRTIEQADLAEMEQLWQAAKAEEPPPGSLTPAAAPTGTGFAAVATARVAPEP